jgi:hypothetical protein
MKCDRLTAGGIWVGDAARLLGGVPKNITAFVRAWVSHAARRSRARAHLASLSVILGFNASAMSPQRGMGQEISWWRWSHLFYKRRRAGLCQPVLARAELEVGPAWRQQAHSASCAAALAWISASSRYNMYTPSAGSGGEVFRGLATVASAWPPHGCWRGPLPWPKHG